MNRDAKFYFRVTMVVIFALFIGWYSYFQSRKLIGGPQIVIESPQNGATVKESLVEIKGKASNIKDISLNDRPIFIDEQGNFDEKLLVPPGYTIMSMKADDRFGRKTSQTLELYYDAPPIVPTVTPVASSTATSTNP
jgi:hypothetical protein